MTLHRNPQTNFELHVRRITSAGVELPPTIDQLRGRLKDFQRESGGHAMRDRLAAAVITADPETDRDLLWAAALAEASANPPLVADLREAVRLQVNRAIRATYSEVAVPTYLALSEQFNTAAQAFTAAAAVVDVELPAAAAINLPTKEQQAWKNAAAAVADLNRLTGPLKSAAVLAGICEETADADLALMVDPAAANRRQLWDAWEIEQTEAKAERAAANQSPFTTAQVVRSRCGRWSAVLTAGAILRACPPDAWTEYRRPGPMVEQVIDGRRVMVDPEAPDYQPPTPPRISPPLTRTAR
jgi:hypothetical protein